jgi:hypothetical protein
MTPNSYAFDMLTDKQDKDKAIKKQKRVQQRWLAQTGALECYRSSPPRQRSRRLLSPEHKDLHEDNLHDILYVGHETRRCHEVEKALSPFERQRKLLQENRARLDDRKSVRGRPPSNNTPKSKARDTADVEHAVSGLTIRKMKVII